MLVKKLYLKAYRDQYILKYLNKKTHSFFHKKVVKDKHL